MLPGYRPRAIFLVAAGILRPNLPRRIVSGANGVIAVGGMCVTWHLVGRQRHKFFSACLAEIARA
jgi:hypothetical protein